MKIQVVVAVVVTCAVGWWAQSRSSAQAPAAAPQNAPPIVVVDLSTVAQNSDRIKQATAAIRADADQKRAALKQESDRANQITEKAMSMPAGSPERKKLEEEVLRMKADFELKGKRFDRDLRENEMKTMAALVNDVNAELAKYAQANGTILMLHGDPSPTDLNDPKAIQQELGKLVVYHRGLDITPKILEGVNRRSAAANSTGRAAGQSRPVQR